MRRLGLILLVCCATTPAAGQRLSRHEQLLAATFTTMVWVDVAQTRYGLQHGGHEANPLLGTHPSPVRLTVSATAAAAAVIGIAAAVPPRWRRLVLYAGILAEALTVSSNAAVTRNALQVGLRF